MVPALLATGTTGRPLASDPHCESAGKANGAQMLEHEL